MVRAAIVLVCALFGHLDTGVFKEAGCDGCGYGSIALCRVCGSHYRWRD